MTQITGDYLPPRGSKVYRLLSALLAGEEIDILYAYLELNIPAVQARCAELRAAGWPIRTLDKPHPKLPREKVKVYVLDTQFRRWIAENPEKHPRDYPVQAGRGKWATH